MATKQILKTPKQSTLAAKNKYHDVDLVKQYLDKEIIKKNYHSIT